MNEVSRNRIGWLIPRQAANHTARSMGSRATMDQTYAAMKNLRVAGPFERITVNEPEPPEAEGIASFWTYGLPGKPTMVACRGADPVPLAAALGMKP